MLGPSREDSKLADLLDTSRPQSYSHEMMKMKYMMLFDVN